MVGCRNVGSCVAERTKEIPIKCGIFLEKFQLLLAFIEGLIVTSFPGILHMSRNLE